MLPDVIAMLFADDVHHDRALGKFTIMGTYSSIGVPHFPWTQPVLIVYLAFTDGQGKLPVQLRLIDADEFVPPSWRPNERCVFQAYWPPSSKRPFTPPMSYSLSLVNTDFSFSLKASCCASEGYAFTERM